MLAGTRLVALVATPEAMSGEGAVDHDVVWPNAVEATAD
jgi:hypothetical protein